ncbi:hypothetical protein E1263_09085 [Kribbella antibiotica]|uniref:DUF4386 domain-containing protein n=1 Tax=Kribbella antibiotica TaxID=190195 RepID=A0A4R4ZRS6_9ACTN|nr:hypothetical protein [Kribbella antibiotica]TDD60946.1 hypothetical protein E1263_09085 [Kribbella antibiotica]
MTLPNVYRAAAVAGLASGLVLLVNTAKRAELIPTSAATQLVAPLAQVLALGLVAALFARTGRRGSIFGVVAFGLNFTAITLLVGVEFVLNLVFPRVDGATVTSLRAGPLGVALTVSSILFLISTAMFAASLWHREGPPRPALILYAVGAIPVSLRAAVPEAALQAGLLLLAVAIGWLALWLWSSAREPLPA